MPTKSKKSVSSMRKQGFEFKPWHAFLIIAAIVITGYVIVRFSNASGASGPTRSNFDPQAVSNVRRDWEACNGNTATLNINDDNPCVIYVRRFFKDVVNDTSTSETGPMDVGTSSQVQDFQDAVNSAFVLATANYPVPATIDDAKLNELASKGFITSAQNAKLHKALDTDGVVGPMTWTWINTITYTYLVCADKPATDDCRK